jgi:hypothetical protein
MRASYVAYLAAALFAVRLATFFVAPLRDATATTSPVAAEVIAVLGIAPHLLLFPVAAALPAPSWGRAAGYGWLVIDMATDIMQLGGVDQTTYLGLRYGGHISAGSGSSLLPGRQGSGSASSACCLHST